MWDKNNVESVVVLLQRTQLSLYSSSHGKIVTLPFDAAVVNDLEVIDEDAFCKQLTGFIQQQKLGKSSVVLLLDSSIYFSQKAEIEAPAKAEQETEAPSELSEEKTSKPSVLLELENKKKLFAQSVPFASVFSTVITIGKEKFLLALNRDFYEPVIKVFSEKDLQVVSILPIAVVSPIFSEEGFTPQTAIAILNSIDKFKVHNLLEGSLKTEQTMVSTALPSDPSDKRRLALMVGVFIILIGILIAVILWSRQRDQQLAQTPVPPPPTPVVQPSPTPVPTPTLASSAASLTDTQAASASTQSSENSAVPVAVEIIDASGGATSSALLQQQLTEAGYVGVTVTAGQVTITGPVVITYSSQHAVNFVEAIGQTLSSLGYQTRFEETANPNADLTITLTNQ